MSNMPGLFVIGEANFSDHGANRLGASALMQGLADGYFVIPYTLPAYMATQKPGTVTTAHPAFKEAEAQVAALADDIAYNNHDVDDGVEAGLFFLKELLDVPLIGPVLHGVRRDWPDIDERMIRIEAVRRMIGAMVDDVLAETRRRADGLKGPEDVRNLDHNLFPSLHVAFACTTAAAFGSGRGPSGRLLLNLWAAAVAGTPVRRPGATYASRIG